MKRDCVLRAAVTSSVFLGTWGASVSETKAEDCRIANAREGGTRVIDPGTDPICASEGHDIGAQEVAKNRELGAVATGEYAVAIGIDAVAGGAQSLAFGYASSTYVDDAIALGARSQGTQTGTVSFGADGTTDANGDGVVDSGDVINRRLVNVADGVDESDAATVGQVNAVAAGFTAIRDTADCALAATATNAANIAANSAELSQFASASLEGEASASGDYALAIGGDGVFGDDGLGAQATGFGALAIGADANAATQRSFAIGYGAQALGGQAFALGTRALASNTHAMAMGSDASANAFRAVAVGDSAVASGSGSTALGQGAKAAHVGSTAIGQNAATTADNQIMLGTQGTAVVVADMASSTDAQQGVVYTVTVDENGVLGRQASARPSSVNAGFDQLRSQMDAISAVTDAQFATLSNEVAVLTGRVGMLEQGYTEMGFRLEDYNRSAMGGIAAATALGSAIAMPDKKFVISGNLATHGGQQGYAASFTGRMSESFAIGAGLAGNTADNEVTAQVGVAFGF